MITAPNTVRFTHPSLLKPNTHQLDFRATNQQDPIAANTPDMTIQRLVEGNQTFMAMREYRSHRQSIRLSAVAKGQKSFAAILNYAELSTSTEELFDRKFGELFVINAPNQSMNFAAISALEYGVTILGISAIVVLGDMNPAPTPSVETETPNSNRLKVAIDRRKILVSGRPQQPVVDAAANISDRVAKLKSTPLLARLIQSGDLKIVGALHDPTQGSVTILS